MRSFSPNILKGRFRHFFSLFVKNVIPRSVGRFPIRDFPVLCTEAQAIASCCSDPSGVHQGQHCPLFVLKFMISDPLVNIRGILSPQCFYCIHSPVLRAGPTILASAHMTLH